MRLDAALDGFARHLRAERGLSAHTVTAYESDLRSLLEFIESTTSLDEPVVDDPGVDRLTLDLRRDWLWRDAHRACAGLPRGCTAPVQSNSGDHWAWFRGR